MDLPGFGMTTLIMLPIPIVAQSGGRFILPVAASRADANTVCDVCEWRLVSLLLFLANISATSSI